MSVIVLGMEMPESCWKCLFGYLHPEVMYFCTRKSLNLDEIDYETERHPDCPLRPLPDAHGRLIDADAFKAFVQEKWEQNEIRNGDWMDFREWLRDQETIIEAEGEV